MLFKSKGIGLMDVVNGAENIEHRENAENIKSWISKDARAHQIILRTVEHQVKPQLVMCDIQNTVYKLSHLDKKVG